MRTITAVSVLTLTLGLAGCAGMMRTTPSVGDPVATVTAKYGKPTAVYATGAGKELEYTNGPMGQTTWMAHIDADGKLTSFEQVLTEQKFAMIKVGNATKEDVLRTIGRPGEQSHVAQNNYEVWTYRYKENGVWNSMLQVHFDKDGVVRLMENTPDQMFKSMRS